VGDPLHIEDYAGITAERLSEGPERVNMLQLAKLSKNITEIMGYAMDTYKSQWIHSNHLLRATLVPNTLCYRATKFAPWEALIGEGTLDHGYTDYEGQRIYTMSSFWSSSTKERKAMGAAGFGQRGDGVGNQDQVNHHFIVCNIQGGGRVHPISCDPVSRAASEEERLFYPGTKFIVKNMEVTGAERNNLSVEAGRLDEVPLWEITGDGVLKRDHFPEKPPSAAGGQEQAKQVTIYTIECVEYDNTYPKKLGLDIDFPRLEDLQKQAILCDPSRTRDIKRACFVMICLLNVEGQSNAINTVDEYETFMNKAAIRASEDWAAYNVCDPVLIREELGRLQELEEAGWNRYCSQYEGIRIKECHSTYGYTNLYKVGQVENMDLSELRNALLYQGFNQKDLNEMYGTVLTEAFKETRAALAVAGFGNIKGANDIQRIIEDKIAESGEDPHPVINSVFLTTFKDRFHKAKDDFADKLRPMLTTINIVTDWEAVTHSLATLMKLSRPDEVAKPNPDEAAKAEAEAEDETRNYTKIEDAWAWNDPGTLEIKEPSGFAKVAAEVAADLAAEGERELDLDEFVVEERAAEERAAEDRTTVDEEMAEEMAKAEGEGSEVTEEQAVVRQNEYAGQRGPPDHAWGEEPPEVPKKRTLPAGCPINSRWRLGVKDSRLCNCDLTSFDRGRYTYDENAKSARDLFQGTVSHMLDPYQPAAEPAASSLPGTVPDSPGKSSGEILKGRGDNRPVENTQGWSTQETGRVPIVQSYIRRLCQAFDPLRDVLGDTLLSIDKGTETETETETIQEEINTIVTIILSSAADIETQAKIRVVSDLLSNLSTRKGNGLLEEALAEYEILAQGQNRDNPENQYDMSELELEANEFHSAEAHRAPALAGGAPTDSNGWMEQFLLTVVLMVPPGSVTPAAEPAPPAAAEPEPAAAEPAPAAEPEPGVFKMDQGGGHRRQPRETIKRRYRHRRKKATLAARSKRNKTNNKTRQKARHMKNRPVRTNRRRNNTRRRRSRRKNTRRKENMRKSYKNRNKI